VANILPAIRYPSKHQSITHQSSVADPNILHLNLIPLNVSSHQQSSPESLALTQFPLKVDVDGEDLTVVSGDQAYMELTLELMMDITDLEDTTDQEECTDLEVGESDQEATAHHTAYLLKDQEDGAESDLAAVEFWE
jgi:hypothetical protein